MASGGRASLPLAPWHWETSPSDVPFCAPVDSTVKDLALGVVTTERAAWRSGVRRYLHADSPRVVVRLVLRGINASEEVRNESLTYGDIVFLPSPATMTSGSGPLTSTLQWLHCAATAWPKAAFVGKAEDDTWLHLPDIVMSLHASQATLAARGDGDVDLYWGMMESYFWNETAQRPFGFGHNMPPQMWAAPCTVNATGNASRSRGVVTMDHRISTQHGPFVFAKGALYILSTRLAARLTTDAPTRRRAAQALASADERRSGGAAGVAPYAEGSVWEDVWLGYALSRLEPPPRLGVVTLGWSQYMEEWGFTALPTTMVWHAKTKDADRPWRMQAWAAANHCARRGPTDSRARLPGRTPCLDARSSGGRVRGGSCAGGEWIFCVDDSERRCPRAKANLNNRSAWRAPNGEDIYVAPPAPSVSAERRLGRRQRG